MGANENKGARWFSGDQIAPGWFGFRNSRGGLGFWEGLTRWNTTANPKPRSLIMPGTMLLQSIEYYNTFSNIKTMVGGSMAEYRYRPLFQRGPIIPLITETPQSILQMGLVTDAPDAPDPRPSLAPCQGEPFLVREQPQHRGVNRNPKVGMFFPPPPSGSTQEKDSEHHQGKRKKHSKRHQPKGTNLRDAT